MEKEACALIDLEILKNKQPSTKAVIEDRFYIVQDPPTGKDVVRGGVVFNVWNHFLRVFDSTTTGRKGSFDGQGDATIIAGDDRVAVVIERAIKQFAWITEMVCC